MTRQSLNPTASAITSSGCSTQDQSNNRFALVLPGLMAFLLALVPILGTSARIPFLLVLVPLVLWSAFRDTERAIYVYIAWCWMDGTIRGVFDSSPVAIVARDIVMGVIVVGWAARRLQTRGDDPIRFPPTTLLVGLFVILCILQLANPFSLGLVRSLAGLKVHLTPLPMFFLAYDVFRHRSQIRTLLLFLTLATLVIGAVSLVQYTQGRDWTWTHFPGTKEVISQNMHASTVGAKLNSEDLFKPPGTTGFGGGAGWFIGFVFPLPFCLLLLSGPMKFSKLFRIFFGGCLFAFILLIFINGNRSSLVDALVCVLAFGMMTGGRLRVRTFTAALACLGVGLFGWSLSQVISGGVTTDRFSSLFSDPIGALHNDRKTLFEEYGTIALNSPMGVGLGRIGAAAGHLGTASQHDDIGFSVFSEAYLGNMTFETGIIGAVLVSVIAASFLWLGYRALQALREPDDRLLASALLSVLLTLVLNFVVVSILLGPPGSILYWLCAAVLLRVFLPPTAARVQGIKQKG